MQCREVISSNSSHVAFLNSDIAKSAAMDEAAPVASSSVGDGVDKQLPLGQAIKMYPKIVGYCLALTLAVVGWGYDLVIVGAIVSVDGFKEDYGTRHEGDLIIPVHWTSMWLGLPPVGTAVGAILGGWLQDRIGRRFSLLAGSIISSVAIGVIFASFLPQSPDTRRLMYTVGMTVQGFSVGIIKNACMTYVSENAPSAIRASAMALFPTFTLLGQLLGLLVVFLTSRIEGRRSYMTAFGSQWVLSIAPFVVSLIMPDSPTFHLNKGNDDKALRSCTRLFAPKVDPQTVMIKYRETIEEERAMNAGITYLTCFQGTHLRRTMIVVLANSMPALFGLDLLSNAPLFLTTLGMDSSIALLIMMGGIVAGMAANGTGIYMLSRIGRRTVTLWSLGGAAILWGGMGATGFFEGKAMQWATCGIMISIIVVCGLGCWSAGYAIMGETSSLRLRAKTQALGAVAAQATSTMMAVVLPYIFQKDAADLGGKTGFVYTALCLFTFTASWLWLPEMKGRSAMEIDHMFDIRLPTRKFKNYKTE